MKRLAHIYARTFFLTAVLTIPALAAQKQDALKQFVGKWRAMVSFTASGGRFTASLAEQVVVKQPDQHTIEFSIKPVTADEPVFHTRLSHNVAGKTYLLTVKTTDSTRANSSVLENLKLSYQSTGFLGEGVLTDPSGKSHPVKVQIAGNDKGEYDWSVRDPSASAGNDLVFSFTFLKRIE